MDCIRIKFYDNVNDCECNLIIDNFDLELFRNFDTKRYKFLGANLIRNCSMEIRDFIKTDEKLETGEQK